MENLNFDTHENVKRYLSVGFTEEQAEMQVKVMNGWVNEQQTNRDDHAKLQLSIEELRRDTKLSIEELRRDMEKGHDKLKMSIEELRQEMKLSQIELKHDLTLRLGGIMVGSMVILFGMLKLSL